MFQFLSRNKKMFITFFIVLALLSLFFSKNSFSMQHYEKLDFVTGLVTASALNVRSGPRNRL